MTTLFDKGDITHVSDNRIIWTLRQFFNLPQTVDTPIFSPNFRLLDEQWKLVMYPRGSYPLVYSVKWFGMCLINYNYQSLRAESLDVRFGFTEPSGTEINSFDAKWLEAISGFGELRAIPCSKFYSKRAQMAPDGCLRIFCEVQKSGGDLKAAASIQTKPELGLKEPENAEANNQADSGKQEATLPESILKLQQDFEALLSDDRNSDVTLVVNGKEFKAHRLILSARSPVFSAMMEHNMKEKSTGVVTIEDVNLETFSDFLRYLYAGSTENVNSENAVNLYTIANKYQTNELRNACLKHMMSNISIENLCEVLVLSLKHQETELTDVATQFFLENSEDIILTAKWQTFLCENPIIGNELFIKALRMKRQ